MENENDASEEDQSQIQPVGNDDIQLPDQSEVVRTPFAEARAAMILICVLLAGFAVLSLGSFIVQFFVHLPNGDRYAGTALGWPAVLGHFLRGVGLALMCWRLAQYVRLIEPNLSELDGELAVRHRVFWRTFAIVFLVVTAYATFQVFYTSWQDGANKEAHFRPEFASGRAPFRKDRIEIRRGYDEPKEGLRRMPRQGSKDELFVAAEPEITGQDIAQATIEISEIFPGHQNVVLQVKFTEGGARKMENLTRAHQTLPLAVLVDGKLRAAPRVFSIISGDAQLSGVLTLEEAAKIIVIGGDK